MSSDHLTSCSCACRQRGFVRSNCIDCLDRTNALQTLMGVDALGFQLDLVLERLGYLERYGRFSPISCAHYRIYIHIHFTRTRFICLSYGTDTSTCTSISTFYGIVYSIVYILCTDISYIYEYVLLR